MRVELSSGSRLDIFVVESPTGLDVPDELMDRIRAVRKQLFEANKALVEYVLSVDPACIEPMVETLAFLEPEWDD